MQILGIDYGQKKVGIAFASATLADPLMVIRYNSPNELLDRLKKIISDYKIEKIVLGISEHASAQKSREFAKVLEEKFNLIVDFEDETLSSLDAQTISMQLGIKRKKRKTLEDAYAATLILQSYLDKISK